MQHMTQTNLTKMQLNLNASKMKVLTRMVKEYIIQVTSELSKKYGFPLEEALQCLRLDILQSASTKNSNQEWKHILNTLLPQNPTFPRTITTQQIKECRRTWQGKDHQFEPRLLAKMDSLEDRPEIFRVYGIHILSSTNSSYILTHANIYELLEYNDNCEVTRIERNRDSCILGFGDSESSFLDNLRYSGLFERETYLNEPIQYGPLLTGRHRCSFDTHLQEESISIQGVQFETDGCYESKNKILLIEAKSMTVHSFNVRQLYFPYRTLYERTKGKKEIISIFITKDKKTGIFHIWKFIFEHPFVMSSIQCIAYNQYKFV